MNGAAVLTLALTFIALGARGQEEATVAARQGQQRSSSCTTRRQASSLAVSIVYSVCADDVVIAAQSIASASASGCGDSYAATLGISLATMSQGSLTEVSYAAFTAALSITSSYDRAMALAEAMTVAVVSATPSLLTRTDMLAALAQAVLLVAEKQGCQVAVRLVLSVSNTLLATAPEMQTVWTDQVASIAGAYAPANCPRLPKHLERRLDKAYLQDKPGGKGCGAIKRPIFSSDIDKVRATTSLAVSIAQVACPSQSGDAAVIAVAVATAASTDVYVAADAIAGVATAGLDITAFVTEMYTQAAPERRRAVAQAYATAIVASTPEQQAKLLAALYAALKVVASQYGCTEVTDLMALMQGVGVTPQASQLCLP